MFDENYGLLATDMNLKTICWVKMELYLSYRKLETNYILKHMNRMRFVKNAVFHALWTGNKLETDLKTQHIYRIGIISQKCVFLF